MSNAKSSQVGAVTPCPSPATPPASSPAKGLRFAGYAALFGVPDSGGDIIQRGAFTRTLTDHGLGDLARPHSTPHEPIPILWQHRRDLRIGWVEHLAEDERGLQVLARLDSISGIPARSLLRGSVRGLSFGYRTRASRQRGHYRELLDLDLFEISLVSFPMQHGARVHLIS